MTGFAHALRQCLSRPGFSGLLVLILALGIGVNAAMFGITDRVLFRPVPVADPDSLVRVFTHDPVDGELGNGSHPWLREMAALEGSVFSGLAAYSDYPSVPVGEADGSTTLVRAGVAGGAFFDVLGVRAALGRTFGRETAQGAGQHPVVVLSHRYWQARFNGAEDVIGRTLRVTGQPYTIIGVLPPGFEGPSLGTEVAFWLPLAMANEALAGQFRGDPLENRGSSWLDGVARLAPGVSRVAAAAAVDAWAQRMAASAPNGDLGFGRGPFARLLPLREAAVDPYGTEGADRKAWLLLAVAASVLLIAALNAAGLLAVRGEERVRELAVRMSLGAGPRRLLSQLALETLLLVMAGAALGLVLAAVLVRVVVAAAPEGLVLPEDAWASLLQPRVLAMTTCCAAAALALSLLAPARRALRVDVAAGLRGGGLQGTATPGRQRWRATLVAAQLALGMMLLVGAGLLLRSLWNTEAVSPGFRGDGMVAASVSLARPGLTPVERMRLLDAMRERAAALPGASAVAWMATPPVQPGGMRRTAETGIPGSPEGDAAHVEFNSVSPGALSLLEVPLLRGRDFDAGDDGRRGVVLVNRTFAERFFPGLDPIGQRIPAWGPEASEAEVVGVVGDVRQRSLREPPPPQVYVPVAGFDGPRMTLLVDAGDSVADVIGALPRALAEVDPGAAVYALRTLDAQTAQTMAQARLFAWLLIGFGVLAALLAATGLYGTVSYWLRGRTRELGIRMALGATAPRVAALVGRQGGGLLLLALPAGVALAYAGARALSSLTYGVGALDPLAWGGAFVLLLASVAVATWWPIRRAARLEPMVALREE